MRRLMPVLAVVLPVLSFGQEQSVKPGINHNYLDPNLKVEDWVERFETESREIFHQREGILKEVGLKPGMSVADIGAGTGLFSFLFAKEVGGQGKVYAVDIAQKFVEHIRARAAKDKVSQVEAVLCTDKSVNLPEASIDLAFLCDVYHHLEFPRESMTSLHKALKPGGQLILIDFRRIEGVSSQWTLDHVRAGQEVFEREIAACGFEKAGQVDGLLKENYLVRFRKK